MPGENILISAMEAQAVAGAAAGAAVAVGRAKTAEFELELGERRSPRSQCRRLAGDGGANGRSI